MEYSLRIHDWAHMLLHRVIEAAISWVLLPRFSKLSPVDPLMTIVPHVDVYFRNFLNNHKEARLSK